MGSREKLALKFYLAKALVQATPSQEQLLNLYRRFARLPAHGDVVISFNWDTLLETALDAVSMDYTYNFASDRFGSKWP